MSPQENRAVKGSLEELYLIIGRIKEAIDREHLPVATSCSSCIASKWCPLDANKVRA